MTCIRWYALGCLYFSVVQLHSQQLVREAKPGFSVKDSIEMTTFSDPYTRSPSAACKLSPDGKHFMVITTRGLLRNDHLESSLWTYSKATIERYLSGKTAHAPWPHLLLRIAGVPQALQINSYGSLIATAQWSSDSQSILSLVENRDGHRHIFRMPLSGRNAVDITPGDATDVQSFSEANGTIAYLVRDHAEASRQRGREPIAKDASTVLTGSTLFHILFPEKYPYPSSFGDPLVLWVHYKGANWRVRKSTEEYFPAGAARAFRMALSPNGRSLIAAQPVPEIPVSWSAYQSALSTVRFHPPADSADRTGKSFDWPWQYSYTDLDRRSSRPLVAAPSDHTTGYGDVFQASWSKAGEEILFTSSYLPLPEKVSKKATEALKPCAVAIYRLSSGAVACIAYARFPERNEHLRSAAFGRSDDEIVLGWLNNGAEASEVYERTGAGWMLTTGGLHNDPGTETILSLRQDINDPPSLWATDKNRDTSKLLWNPNRQLASIALGQAKVYSWQDSSGYKWRGGLVLPPEFVPGHRYPLVLQTHGFYNDHEFLVDGSYTTGFAAQPLAAAGMIVLQVEDREDRHSRPAREEALSQVQGFESAIDHLDKDGLIDPSRVGIIGFSRTAWYVEQALIHAPHRYRAATLIDGVDQSYLTYMLFSVNYPLAARESEGANNSRPFGDGLEQWLKSAAGFNLDKVEAPVRLEAIGTVSVLGAWETYSSLFHQRKAVDFIEIPDGQHILQKPEERYASQQGNVDWFRFWLQGYIDPDSAKRGQYQRWRKLAAIKQSNQE